MAPYTDFRTVAISLDGQVLFVEVHGPSWSGVIERDRTSNQETRIWQAQGGEDQVSNADFDGQWLVWSESHSLSNSSDWTILAWNKADGGVVKTITVAPRVNGSPIVGPFIVPVVANGQLAWSQSDPGGGTSLHLYDLAAGRDSVVSADHPGSPVIAWPWLLWGAANRDGSPGRAQGSIADRCTSGDSSPRPCRPRFAELSGRQSEWSGLGDPRLSYRGTLVPARSSFSSPSTIG